MMRSLSLVYSYIQILQLVYSNTNLDLLKMTQKIINNTTRTFCAGDNTKTKKEYNMNTYKVNDIKAIVYPYCVDNRQLGT